MTVIPSSKRIMNRRGCDVEGMTLQQAEKKAREFAKLVGPKCVRTMIAGSIRRMKPSGIKDVELVVEPRYVVGAQQGLFGADSHRQENVLWGYLKELDAAGVITGRRDKHGKRFAWIDNAEPKYVALWWEGVAVDLFIVTSERLPWWGYHLWLRTGPGDVNTVAARMESMGGLRPNNVQLSDGEVWVDGKPYPVPDEDAMFRVLGMMYVPPQQRTVAAYETAKWQFKRAGYKQAGG